VAGGILSAVAEVGGKCPIVIRLEGTNAKQARAMLMEQGGDMNFHLVDNMDDASRMVVEFANN
jgi:succinyl-CoA synthetase beta subunit